jgi:glycosyltransferase involved in cell wall biosynthesis
MHISVILATYKRPQILFKTLDSFTHLETEDLIWELLVIDNAGDPDTRGIAEGFLTRLPLRFFVEKTAGKNNALNSGVKEASGDLFVFTDDDIIADPRWLIEMWEGSKRWPEFSVFGGRILPDFPTKKIPISSDNSFFNQAYTVADWDIKEGPYQANMVWGPNMAVCSKLFESDWTFNAEVGPNGKNYIMGSETEFTSRLERAGFKPVYLPESILFHQIRPEQLKVSWLLGRAYRAGRSVARKSNTKNMPLAFGVPKHLIKSFIIVTLKLVIMILISKKKAIDQALQHYRMRGMIYQFFKDSEDKKKNKIDAIFN